MAIRNDPVDLEAFRLRRFLDLLRDEGELETVSEQIDLVDLGSRLDGNPKAVLFQKPGPDGKPDLPVVGNVLGSRRRLALAFGVGAPGLLKEVLKRTAPIAPIEVPSSMAPVHQLVWTGKDADFTRLPVHLQHGHDGGPYISASIDITKSIDGKKRNLGYRRLMLRGRTEAGVDMIAPSDFRAMYQEYVKPQGANAVASSWGLIQQTVCGTAMSLIDDEVELMGPYAARLSRSSVASPSMPWCRPMPRSSSKATWTNAGGWNPRGRTANTSVTTAA
jgi:3-polyprenyl-4-hydroxybenzoate decarboxylase and related decarboxylases